MMGNGFGFGFGFPGLGMVLFWGLIILLVVWVVRSFSAGSTGRDKSARQILDERFAKGEIDREEYEQKKQALG
jgi:putative membrane protein